MSARVETDPDDVRDRLTRRIVAGEQLRAAPPAAVQELELEIQKWDDFNVDLLRRLFASGEIADDYREVHVGRVLYPDDHVYAREFFLELLTRKLTKLTSIRDRLSLLELSHERSVPDGDQSDPVTMPLDLFISHSSEDAGLVEHLADLLRNSLQLQPDRIRATAVDSYRLPGGAATNETLRQETIETQAFVGVISPRSLASLYVVFELGARWGSGGHFVPVVTSDLSADLLGGPLRDINYLRCTNTDLHALVRQLGGVLRVAPLTADQYQRHVDRVVEADTMPTSEHRPANAANDTTSDEPVLDVECRALHAAQPPNWSGSWRLSMEVINSGTTGEFQVKLLRGVKGLDDDDYGNFLLQWDMQEDETRRIHHDDSAIVHVARSQDRTIRFLGPSTVYGPQTFYKEVRPVGEVWGEVEVRDVTSGQYHRTPMKITFDHEHKPYLEFPEQGD